MLSGGKAAFFLLAAALAVVLLASYDRMPDVVASHFDGAGVPNGWSSRSAYLLLLLAIGVLMPLSAIGVVLAVTRSGPRHLNIPARDYWTRPEHGAEAVRRVRAYMWWLGAVLAASALLVHLTVMEANRTDPPHLRGELMLLLLGGVLLAIGCWVVGWFRLLRPPRP